MCRYNLDMDEIRDELLRTEYKALPMSEQGMLCVANSKQARVTLTSQTVPKIELENMSRMYNGIFQHCINIMRSY